MALSEHGVQACFHCGLDADPAFSAPINNQQQAFCCIGCQAVATAIEAGGLVDFYRFRDAQNRKPEEDLERFDAYDLVDVQAAFVDVIDGDTKRVSLLIGGITCAACAWLIENYLEKLDGVSSVRVNVASHRCSFEWRSADIKLSAVFLALHRIGYRPQPGTEAQSQQLRKTERRNALLRIGVAGLGMMQVGMVAIALHAGAIQGIGDSAQHFLRWVSLIFAVPVMFYSAQPFFKSAHRSLRMRHLNMDVPVSLALVLAFFASVYGTVTNTGEVYFDSVSMFTFFLLVGRFLEMQARHTSVYETERLSQLLPFSVERVLPGERGESDSGLELIPLSYLKEGDVVRVAAGDVIPCDGYLQSSLAMADESLLTGESDLVEKSNGDPLYAGSILSEPSANIRVSAVGEQTRLASVQALLNKAISTKPKQQQMADSVARYFVAAVLVCFVAVFGAWYFVDPSRAFWIALSVLVVTCPCALSLATPAALAAGLNRLRNIGLLVVSPSALETLPSINHIALDKTGTLTLGEPRLQKVEILTSDKRFTSEQVVECVAALESFSRHPIANAFKDISTSVVAEQVRATAGKGLEGHIKGQHFRFGLAQFASPERSVSYPSEGNWQLLSCDAEPIAWFLFADEARPNLKASLIQIKAAITKASLFSGDRQNNIDSFVQRNALQGYFEQSLGEMLPEDKLAKVNALQTEGDRVLMVGDGINDIPVLAAADLSVAMGSASQLAKVNADAVLLNQNLSSLSEARTVAVRVSQVIKQNFAWALGYNILALPAAALGYIPPYLAALGMSLSSLVVVLNSLRVNRQ